MRRTAALPDTCPFTADACAHDGTLPFRATAEPKFVPSILNWTLPVGVPAPGATGATVAPNVVPWPKTVAPALVTLVAPVDSVVLEIAKLSPGSIVREAETFFTLVPLNTTLEAEVQINSVDVGYIKSGMPVHVKLDAYPFQRHGALDATVNSISEDAFKRDVSAKSSVDAYYLVRLRLGSTNLRNMAESARFLPGMTLSAEIVVGKRSVISYFAWPLTKGLDEALREPR